MASRARNPGPPPLPPQSPVDEFEEAAPTTLDAGVQHLLVEETSTREEPAYEFEQEVRTRESREVVQTLAAREALLSQELRTLARDPMRSFERELPTNLERPRRSADLPGVAPPLDPFASSQPGAPPIGATPLTPPPLGVPLLAPVSRPSQIMPRPSGAALALPRGSRPWILLSGLALLGMGLGALGVALVSGRRTARVEEALLAAPAESAPVAPIIEPTSVEPAEEAVAEEPAIEEPPRAAPRPARAVKPAARAKKARPPPNRKPPVEGARPNPF